MTRWRRCAESAWRSARLVSVRAGADDVLPVMSVPFVSSGLLAEAGHAEADGAVVRATATPAHSCRGSPAMSPSMRLMSCRILLISCSEGGGGGACPFAGAAGGGQPFPGAQHVVEVGGRVRQERRCTRAAVVLDRVREGAARAGRTSHCSQVISPLR